MGNYKSKRENDILKEVAEILAVENERDHQAFYQLDRNKKGIHDLDDMYTSAIAIQNQIIDSLKAPGQKDDKKVCSQLDEISQILDQDIFSPEESEQIDTIHVTDDWAANVTNSRLYAEKHKIDLSNPYYAMFSDVERQAINRQLIEKFDLCYLDQFDYLFAAASGVITGFIDVVLVGTIGTGNQGSLLQKEVDKCFEKIVMAYAKNEKVSLLKEQHAKAIKSRPSEKHELDLKFKKLIQEAQNMDKKQAIASLEYKFQVGYDQSTNAGETPWLTPSNHHLLSLAHDPGLLGLLVGIVDQLCGTTSLINPETGSIVRLASKTAGTAQNPACTIFEAVYKWFGHIMSDIAGSRTSKGRGAGLPVPGWAALQKLQIGNVTINEKEMNFAQMTEWMFVNGYDVRAFTTQLIPVLINESLVRMYWFCKQHFYFGKPIKESIPIANNRELARLLLVATASFSALDIGDALIKSKGADLGTFILTINIPGLIDFGFRAVQNIRNEIEHREKVEEIFDTDIREEWNRIFEA